MVNFGVLANKNYEIGATVPGGEKKKGTDTENCTLIEKEIKVPLISGLRTKQFSHVRTPYTI